MVVINVISAQNKPSRNNDLFLSKKLKPPKNEYLALTTAKPAGSPRHQESSAEEESA